MNSEPQITWKEAFFKNPGPDNFKDFFILVIKGLFMGTGNIIPGVSGGTIALITGIYLDLLESIKSVNSLFIKHLLSFKLREATSVLHIRFLSGIFLGTMIAIITLAQIATYLLNNYPVSINSFFLGLILASTYVVGKDIKKWAGTGGLFFIAGAVSVYFIVGMIPVDTPETWWFILFAGIISISAMILPGLSGAFILIVLGKYGYIVGALKNPFILENIVVIVIFAIGCVLGLAGFSRVLSFLIAKYNNATLAVLTGLMVGSLRKIWPWKETLETKVIHGKVYILSEKNIIPDSFDSEVILAACLCVVGFVIIFLLEKFSAKKE